MTTFDILKNKHEDLLQKGFVKSINGNCNSSGLTLEKLLGRSGGDFNIPDFYDVEIKAIKKYYFANITLFNSGPDGKYVTSTQWLSENYGYPDKDYRNIKVFKGDVFANKFNKVGIKNYYKLDISYSEQRIYLNIYDINKRLINNDIYWDFDSLKEKLERKISKLALFEFDKTYINNEIYYKYYSLKLFTLKGFDKFIDSIKHGFVFITINTGVNKSGPHAGKFVDHGTAFRICKPNLQKLFNLVH